MSESFVGNIDKQLTRKKLEKAFDVVDRYMRAHAANYSLTYPEMKFVKDESGVRPTADDSDFTAVWSFKTANARRDVEELFSELFVAYDPDKNWKVIPIGSPEGRECRFSFSSETLLKAEGLIASSRQVAKAVDPLNARLRQANMDIHFEAAVPYYGEVFAYIKAGSKEEALSLMMGVTSITGIPTHYKAKSILDRNSHERQKQHFVRIEPDDLAVLLLKPEEEPVAKPRKAPVSLLEFAVRKTGSDTPEH